MLLRRVKRNVTPRKSDGHESVRGDISEVAIDEMRKDKLSRNLNMDYEGVKILQVYKT